MDKIPNLDADSLPEFFENFFSTPYTASWLGIYLPNLDDVREFIFSNAEDLDAAFINAAFLDFNQQAFMEGFDERVPPQKINELSRHLLNNYSNLSRFMEEKGELFFIELQFQVPFIHKSRFSGKKKRDWIENRKTRYESFFRKNYTGRFLVIPTTLETSFFEKERHVLSEIKLSSDLISDGSRVICFLQYPEALQAYWEAVLAAILERLTSHS